MNELETIVTAFEAAKHQGKKVALATVVHVEGSSYRRPGARMLITEDGDYTGSISGGCLEGDAYRKAMLVIYSGKPMLVTYDTSDEDDAKFGMGLGCNGVIQVLIEPLQNDAGQQLMQALRNLQMTRQKAVLVCLFTLQRTSSQPGTCLMLTEQGSIQPFVAFDLDEEVKQNALAALADEKSHFHRFIKDSVQWITFYEIVLPPVMLVVAGAGNDVIPLVEMSETLGWKSTVLDGRTLYADKKRFPQASCQVICSNPENVLEHVSVDSRTVFVLMTHNYNYDLELLSALLHKNVCYIGVLGPLKKLNRMIAEMESRGVIISAEKKACIYGPVGLDIDAETSEEIALSILAEIKSVLAARCPTSLRERQQAIHDRSALQIKMNVAE